LKPSRWPTSYRRSAFAGLIAILSTLLLSVDVHAGAVTTLATLDATAGAPSPLVEGPDGNYYGTMSGGGTDTSSTLPYGTIFRVTPQGVYTTLHVFNGTDGIGPTGLVLAPDGNLYGSAVGGGSLTGAPGSYGGTVFKITTGGTFSVIYNFPQSVSPDLMGGGPTALALGADGNLYGITLAGGANGCGALFRLTLAGVATVVYSYPQIGGSSQPGSPPMTLGGNGYLYGNSNEGFFSLSPAGTYQNIYALTESQGDQQTASILRGSDGNLYGAANSDQYNGSGIIFKLVNGLFSTLYTFPVAADGSTSASNALIDGGDGYFYGTTSSGGQGTCQCGQIFKISPTGVFSSLYYFNGTTDFGDPTTPLVHGSDGYFYGATAQSLYRFDPTAVPPAAISLTFSAPVIALGNVSTLNWDASNASGCTASGAWSGAQPISGSLSVKPTATGQATYSMTCTGVGGTATTSATLSVVPPASAAISISPSTVNVGATATLTWSGNGTCVASGAWGGIVSSSGSLQVIPALSGSFVYTLSCTGQGGLGLASASATLMVNPLPTVVLTAAPLSIAPGQTATLTWSSTNATACVASNGWSGNRAVSGSAVVAPTAVGSTRYVLTCTGTGGTSFAGVDIEVAFPIPSVQLTAAPITIISGQSSTLTWSSSNATSCVASGAWSGNLATSGMQTVTPAATGPNTFALSCSGAGGTATSSVVINAAVPMPSLKITAAPTNLAAGQSSIVTWSSSNATGCVASGAWSGTMATFGVQTVTPEATGPNTFALSCSGVAGTIEGSVTVTVAAVPGPTAVLSANTTSITEGESVALSWSSTNATDCSAAGDWNGSVSTAGAQMVTPSSVGSDEYVLSCTGPGGAAKESVTISVAAAAPVPPLSSSSKSGGGSVDLAELLSLAGLLVMTRRRAANGC
jgi:uncharacterized repeat protein (TIGR03803 family)